MRSGRLGCILLHFVDQGVKENVLDLSASEWKVKFDGGYYYVEGAFAKFAG
jgi:hypothetical protein